MSFTSLTTIRQKIHSDLTSYVPLTSLLSNGMQSVRLLLAENSVGTQYVTYSFKHQGVATKANLANYEIVVNSWGADDVSSLQVADQVYNAFANATHYYQYISAETAVTDQFQIYTQQIFNLKS